MSHVDVVVNKPWGHEYLAYENEHVGLWYLFIKKGEKTSLHCHPKKNTGLVLLKGNVRTSFLNGNIEMSSLNKTMIRRGLFHSTLGLADEGSHVFEIETPKDKGDLVRLEDSYGRKLSPYEGKNKERPKDDNCIWIEDPIRGKSNYYSFCDCKILAESILQKDSLYDREGDDIFIFLRGGIVSNEGDPIAQPGDVLNGATLDRLSRVFEITEEIILLSISPEYTGGSGYGCP
jgi:mannose-6-phosphate isomerase-like protein (cupin superfamily)